MSVDPTNELAQAAEIVRRLHRVADEIRRNVDRADAPTGTSHAEPRDVPAALATAGDQLQRLSDELRGAGTELGLDRVLAWKLLELRDWLDSHMLAAQALESADIDPTAALEMIRRGVDGIADRLPGPDDPLVAMVSSGDRSA
jgi:hypothetical protein